MEISWKKGSGVANLTIIEALYRLVPFTGHCYRDDYITKGKHHE